MNLGSSREGAVTLDLICPFGLSEVATGMKSLCRWCWSATSRHESSAIPLFRLKPSIVVFPPKEPRRRSVVEIKNSKSPAYGPFLSALSSM